jgi:uncharacterized protein (TIGR00106 family)
MHVIVDLCVIPLGVGLSVSQYVAACERVLQDAGLKTHLHAYGTNVEGEWDSVFAAVKRCHEVVHGMGAPRISRRGPTGSRRWTTKSAAWKRSCEAAVPARDNAGAAEPFAGCPAPYYPLVAQNENAPSRGLTAAFCVPFMQADE